MAGVTPTINLVDNIFAFCPLFLCLMISCSSLHCRGKFLRELGGVSGGGGDYVDFGPL